MGHMAVESHLTLGTLPIDVVYEILGHLTVEDLLRTRRVSLCLIMTTVNCKD